MSQKPRQAISPTAALAAGNQPGWPCAPDDLGHATQAAAAAEIAMCCREWTLGDPAGCARVERG